MIVCLCYNVSTGDIAREAAAGCCSFESLQEELQVGRACGACESCARDTLRECAGKQKARAAEPPRLGHLMHAVPA
ncbi:MAG: (2Fe-2S)-binding protein [Steroidobacteraceae bacterium]